MEKAIVLLSGGLDSTTALVWATTQAKPEGEKSHYDCMALMFFYEQKHERELGAARLYCELLNIPSEVVFLDYRWSNSCLLQGREPVEGTAFVPGRNIVMLSYAGAIAKERGINNIIGGWNQVDYGGYPDCRNDFLERMEYALKWGLEKPELNIVTPLLDWSKADIVRWGDHHKVRWDLTWSCYNGQDKPCGECNSCINRAKGFKEAGIEDPLVERVGA